MNRNLDDFYTFGDLYETLEACSQMDALLGRVRRQHLMTDEDVTASKQNVENIRSLVEAHLNSSNVTPKAPRLA